jgi:hypothetical protein
MTLASGTPFNSNEEKLIGQRAMAERIEYCSDTNRELEKEYKVQITDVPDILFLTITLCGLSMDTLPTRALKTLSETAPN